VLCATPLTKKEKNRETGPLSADEAKKRRSTLRIQQEKQPQEEKKRSVFPVPEEGKGQNSGAPT